MSAATEEARRVQAEADELQLLSTHLDPECRPASGEVEEVTRLAEEAQDRTGL